MQEERFDGQLGRTILIDICHACHSFWFDTRESVALTPGSTLALFRVIGEKLTRPNYTNAELAKCPRCKAATEQMYANFIYIVGDESRAMLGPAGYFCSKCPTVIVDEDMVKKATRGKGEFRGVVGLTDEEGETEQYFRTWNGFKRSLRRFWFQRTRSDYLLAQEASEDDA